MTFLLMLKVDVQNPVGASSWGTGQKRGIQSLPWDGMSFRVWEMGVG